MSVVYTVTMVMLLLWRYCYCSDIVTMVILFLSGSCYQGCAKGWLSMSCNQLLISLILLWVVVRTLHFVLRV